MDRQGRIGRELVGAILLAVLLLLGLLSAWDMGSTHTAISRQVEDAAWYALTGDWESARLASDSARSRWEAHRGVSSVLADHTPMEEIDALFAKMDYYASAGSAADFGACCARVCRLVEGVADDHRLTWWNLL